MKYLFIIRLSLKMVEITALHYSIFEKCFEKCYIPHVIDLIMKYHIVIIKTYDKDRDNFVYGYFHNKRFIIHREDDLPAIEDKKYKEYRKHGKKHRLNGPAIITPHQCVWYIDGYEMNKTKRKMKYFYH
jgi:hypothetical protein